METPPPDWDLLAVVRSCCTTTSTTTPTVVLPPPPPPPPSLFHFPNVNPFITSSAQDLQDICNPLTTTTTTTTTITMPTTTSTRIFVNNNDHNNNNTRFQPPVSVSELSPVSSSSSFISTRSFGISAQQPRHQQLRRMIKPTQVVFGASHSSGNSTSTSNSQGQRSKKRKNLMKKVCHVPAEGLSNDMWAWRKYGQKPIKGSPYPRGYYRCSSSKGCLARKQVERNRSDPKMFIVTYTAEHNHPMPTHRNSLAGSTRQKPTTTTTTAATTTTTTTSTTTPDNPTCSSPSDNSLSPLTESKTENDDMKEDNGEENDQMGISELMLEDDFYVGFEQIDGDDGSDGFSDRFSPSTEFLWLGNSGNTVTAAGGS